MQNSEKVKKSEKVQKLEKSTEIEKKRTELGIQYRSVDKK